MMITNSSEIKEQHGLIFSIGAWMSIAGIFSIPLLGNAAHNILLGLPIILLLFTKMIRLFPQLLKENKTALLGTLLFCLMALSITWSGAESKYSIKMLSKYREFILIPLFMLYFSVERFRNIAFPTLYLALLLSLIFSYLIHYDIVNYWENEHSISNRIFHGISMSFFAYMTLQASAIFKRFKFLFIALFLIIVHNLFFIENGRTGYLLIASLTALFLLQTYKLKGLLLITLVGVFAAVAVLFLPGLEKIRIFDNFEIFTNAKELSLQTLQQIDVRIEYYIISFLTFTDSWLIGYGIGGFPVAYEATYDSMATFWRTTVNAHNEFLQIGVQTGITGVFLFLTFLLSLLLSKSDYPRVQRQFCSALFVLLFISCLFNSSFLDHGDGTFFMILTALIAGKKWENTSKTLAMKENQ